MLTSPVPSAPERCPKCRHLEHSPIMCGVHMGLRRTCYCIPPRPEEPASPTSPPVSAAQPTTSRTEAQDAGATPRADTSDGSAPATLRVLTAGRIDGRGWYVQHCGAQPERVRPPCRWTCYGIPGAGGCGQTFRLILPEGTA